MAILIDPPQWPAHGTLWSHLVSDVSYEELHEFAARLPVPRRGFDLDHYDVPASMQERAIALGARPVSPKVIVDRLRESGLRVRQRDREGLRPVRRREYLRSDWARLGDLLAINGGLLSMWQDLGNGLLDRWNEPHRRYHDERHLEDVLLALNQLGVRGEEIAPVTLLAAWFHDAVYAGSGTDEVDSARLARESLGSLALPKALVARVSDFIVATTPGRGVQDPPAPLVHLLDADLSIFASPAWRYEEYAVAVREEYAHVPEADFRAGRARILAGYLGQPAIYRTPTAHQLWEERARANLAREIASLRAESAL